MGSIKSGSTVLSWSWEDVYVNEGAYIRTGVSDTTFIASWLLTT